MDQKLFSGYKLFFIAFLLSFSVCGQNTFEKVYPTTYDKTSRDVVATGDGYILVGMTNNTTLNDCDLLVMKTDNNGELLWTKTFGGPRPDYAYDIQETNDGNYFVVGYSQSFSSGGDYDVYLLKIDPSGNLIWQKTYIGFGNEEGREIIKTSDGNFVIVGTTNSNISSQDAFLMKIDGDGTVNWIKYYGGTDKEYGNSVKLCADGGFILTGQTYSWGQGGDAYLVRTNSAGDKVWDKYFGGSQDDEGISIVVNNDDSYTFVVRDSSQGHDVDVRIMKVNGSGDVVWNKLYWGTEKDTPKSIVATSDNGYLVGAISRSFGWINPDMWLLKLNGGGDTLWSRHFGGSDHEHCYSAKQAADGGYLAVGHSRSWSAGQKVYFVKLNNSGVVSVEEQLAQQNSFEIYPNPSTGTFHIVYERPSASVIRVCNTTGQLVYQERYEAVLPGEVKAIDLKNSVPGIYFVTLESQNRMLNKKIVVR